MAILVGDHPSESAKVRLSPLASENLINNQPSWKWKRCKIGGKLVLITIKKSYMTFRSVTLNDLERRNGRVALRYFTEFGKPAF